MKTLEYQRLRQFLFYIQWARRWRMHAYEHVWFGIYNVGATSFCSKVHWDSNGTFFLVVIHLSDAWCIKFLMKPSDARSHRTVVKITTREREREIEVKYSKQLWWLYSKRANKLCMAWYVSEDGSWYSPTRQVHQCFWIIYICLTYRVRTQNELTFNSS